MTSKSIAGKPGLKLQINLESEDQNDQPVSKKPKLAMSRDEDQLSDSEEHDSDDREVSINDKKSGGEGLTQPKSKFQNENNMAKSNLR